MGSGDTIPKAGDIVSSVLKKGDILERWRQRGEQVEGEKDEEGTEPEIATTATKENRNADESSELILPSDHFDLDLAEFPLFRFGKNRRPNRDDKSPILYTDIIKGKGGELVEREWRVYPGPFGYGGESTQKVLYELLQLYVEQGAQDRFIFFGTLRSLFQRQGERNPSKRDYTRIRRDIDILRGYDFHAKNAFWDAKRQAYIDMKWRLFNEVYYPKEKPNDMQMEMPFGAIEVSSVLKHIARSRGFFSLGFESHFFYKLKPLEQRLAIYLSKFFMSQKVHRRFVDDLAKVLPIEAARSDHIRSTLKKAVTGLLEKEFPLLESFTVEKSSSDGRYVATFRRKEGSRRRALIAAKPQSQLPAATVKILVGEIVETTGDPESTRFWKKCVETLGEHSIRRALGQLKETCQIRQVKSRGAMLNKICQDIAKEQGKVLVGKS